MSIGGKREIVTTMDPAWFIVQSLIFSSGGLSDVVLLTTVSMDDYNDDCNGIQTYK